MIFVTIGTQEPFDRLIEAVDEMAKDFKEYEFVIQNLKSSYSPKNCKQVGFLSPQEFDKYLEDSKLIIAHAGMGTIISALVANKKIIVVPRDFDLKEHRNDHQMATARKIEGLVRVVYNVMDLKKVISETLNIQDENTIDIKKWASMELIDSLKTFINK